MAFALHRSPSSRGQSNLQISSDNTSIHDELGAPIIADGILILQISISIFGEMLFSFRRFSLWADWRVKRVFFLSNAHQNCCRRATWSDELQSSQKLVEISPNPLPANCTSWETLNFYESSLLHNCAGWYVENFLVEIIFLSRLVFCLRFNLHFSADFLTYPRRASKQLSATETRKTTDDILWTNQIKNIFGVNFSISFSPAAAANSNVPLSQYTFAVITVKTSHEWGKFCSLQREIESFLPTFFFLLALSAVTS